MIATRPSLTTLSASELANLIAAGDVSSSEVVEAHIERTEAVNPKLNAVVVKRYEAARAEARAADARRASGDPLGPLHGVPVTVKEALDVQGLPSTFGLPSRANVLAREDDPYVARLRAAGAVILGKTNVAQLLLAYESDNPLYGKTNNPWNLGRSAGGSSGGEAAIIAAGGSPLGLATDIAGSVRIPAAFCGVVGFKPTAGRTPDQGRYSVPIGQQAVASQVGVLARTVADAALGLSVIAGTSPGSPPVPLGDPHTVTLPGLRVAYYTGDGSFASAPAAQRAVREAAAILKRQGAEVTEWTPPDAHHALGVFFGLMTADGAKGLKKIIGRNPLSPQMKVLYPQMRSSRALVSGLERVFRAMGQTASAAIFPYVGYRDTHHYWQMVEAQIDYQRRFRKALDTDPGGPFEVVLSPANALPALLHGSGSGPVGTLGASALLYNLLGYPAGAVPFTRVHKGEETTRRPASRDWVENAAYKIEVGSAGLPVGVQVAARPWQDHLALAVMGTLEASAAIRADYPNEVPL